MFLIREKTSFAILIGRIIFFFTCENHRWLLWLAKTNLRTKIYHIAFWWVFLSMYITNCILVSFGYTDQSPWFGLRQKGTILFAFLRWPLSLWLLGVKWIRREQNCRWTLTQAKTVKRGSMLVCRPCDCTSRNLNETSVRETSKGVYLPIGWVFLSYLIIFRLC